MSKNNLPILIFVAVLVFALVLGMIMVVAATALTQLGGGSSNPDSCDTVATPAGGRGGVSGGSDCPAGGAAVPASCDKLEGTPKEIIDNVALPIAHQIDFKDVTAETVTAANATHGSTISGGRSDHQGPPDQAWAADISNGTSPTPEMDELASRLAKCFGFKWSGSGLVTIHKDGYQVQLIYRTMEGGDHYNHVHIGLHRE